MVARGWREGKVGSRCLVGKEFKFCKMEKVLETGYSTM